LEIQDQFSQGNNYIKLLLTNLPLNVRLKKMTSAFYDSLSCKLSWSQTVTLNKAAESPYNRGNVLGSHRVNACVPFLQK